MLTDYDGFAVSGARARDTQEHGTHTAAIIAGRPVAGHYVGVAPEAELYCTTVIEGGNATARILAGLDWVVGQGVKIINLSLGLPGYHEDFHELLETIRDQGILTVAAVGNEFAGTSRSPGNYHNVLSVGACDSKGAVAEFSSSQFFSQPEDRLVPDLVAPGVKVVSAKAGGGYLELSGTSMAAPHVAGLAALLWGAKPSASLEEIESAIFNSCTLGATPYPRANRGLPNGPRAYEVLMGEALPTTARGRKWRVAAAGSKGAKRATAAKNKSAQGVGADRKKARRRPKKK
jgi:subtilisin family serine protease